MTMRLHTLLGRLSSQRAAWPLLALALILIVDCVVTPGHFKIKIGEGHEFGSLIDVLYRAMPTALVALGLAVVIGTKGIDLSVAAVIAICGATIAWRLHLGGAPLAVLGITLAVGLLCRL